MLQKCLVQSKLPVAWRRCGSCGRKVKYDQLGLICLQNLAWWCDAATVPTLPSRLSFLTLHSMYELGRSKVTLEQEGDISDLNMSLTASAQKKAQKAGLDLVWLIPASATALQRSILWYRHPLCLKCVWARHCAMMASSPWQDKKAVSCRQDWHQTSSQVVVTVYAKNPLPALSSVKANRTVVSEAGRAGLGVGVCAFMASDFDQRPGTGHVPGAL